MSFILALGILSVLLALAFACRLAIPVLGRLLLPVALLAGFLGLAAGPHGVDLIPRQVVSTWAAWPAVLITFVFAAIFLGAPVPSLVTVARTAGPLVRFSVVNAMGQYVVGLLLTWLVLTPLFGTPALFACLIEVGFSGGHGTASAMTPVFTDLGFPAAAVLGQMSATVGLMAGVLGGVVLIQWGARRGHATQVAAGEAMLPQDLSGLVPPASRRSIATGTVSAVALEPFTLHVAVTALAILAGWGLLATLQALHAAFNGFPLFPLAMIGGMLVQVLADRTGVAAWFDRATFQRITGLALDLLVAAAVASMPLDLFAQNVVPFSLLMAAGVGWCVVSFVWLAPRMLPRDWFEQGIVVYGTQTGVAAVGLMLLRIADPHQRTTATPAFAARSMVISPLLGGGLVTATMPLLVVRFGVVPILVACAVVTVAAWAWPAGGVRH